jgi:hypothetical protein
MIAAFVEIRISSKAAAAATSYGEYEDLQISESGNILAG